MLLGVVAVSPAQVEPQAGDGNDEEELDLNSMRRRFFETLFDSELPFTNPDSAWEFSVNPKFSDIDDDPYIRLPYEFRYGFTEKREGMIGHTPYIANPFSSSPDGSIGTLDLGVKQRVDSFFNEQIQLALGFKAALPMKEIPTDPWEIRTNYARYEPYMVFTRQKYPLSRWQQVLNISYQWIDESPFGVDTNVPMRPESLFTLRPGLIYKPPGEWRYSLELEYVTERLDGGSGDAFTIVPGVTWFPNRIDRSLPVPGDFDIGLRLGYVLEHLPENEGASDIRVSVRLRWRLDSQSKERLKNYLKGEPTR